MAIYIHAQDLTIRFYKTKITLKLSHLSWFWPGPHCCSHTPSWETRPPASGKVSCAASPAGRWKAPWSILQSLQDKGYNTADRVLAGRAVRKVLLSVHYGSTWFECHIMKKKKNLAVIYICYQPHKRLHTRATVGSVWPLTAADWL